MRQAEQIRINVDPTNPGQFFACCGLLELAGRLWGAAEGWFEFDNTAFVINVTGPQCSFSELIERLCETGLHGELSPEKEHERKALEDRKRRLKKENKVLSRAEEQRRKELGKLLREGMIRILSPFNLLLDWWQSDDDGNPKTWAGSQQVLRIAQAALKETARAFGTDEPFNFKCVIRPVVEQVEDDEQAERKRHPKNNAKEDKAEPFYFDSRHGANALPLDIGFSPNELGMESKAFPAVEVLCLIGLQRCRPYLTETRQVFEYFPWGSPLPITVAPVAVCGFLSQPNGYRFENAYRTDQRKHKGYLPAIPFLR